MHLRLRVTLRADDHVGLVDLHQLHEDPDLLRMQLHVGVDERDGVARRADKAIAKREALAHVRGVAEHLHMWARRLERFVIGVVLAAIADDDDLVVGAQAIERFRQLEHIAGDVGPFHVGRDDDRQHEADSS